MALRNVSQNNSVDNTYSSIEQNSSYAHGHTWSIGNKIEEVINAIIQAIKNLFGTSERTEKTQDNGFGDSPAKILAPRFTRPSAPRSTTTHRLPDVNFGKDAPVQGKTRRSPDTSPSEDYWGIGALKTVRKSTDELTNRLHRMGDKVID